MSALALLMNRWVQLAAGTALGLVFGFGLGHHQKTLEDAQAALRGAQRAIVAVKAQAAVNSAVDQHTAAAIGQVQEHTITLIQKVPVYVPRKADDQCIVGRGAVQLLDAAAGDTVPVAPGGVQAADPSLADADADSGVKLSSIVQADIVNAGSYRQLSERLRAWDEWYTEQARLAK